MLQTRPGRVRAGAQEWRQGGGLQGGADAGGLEQMADIADQSVAHIHGRAGQAAQGLALCLGLITSAHAQVLKIGVIAPMTGAGAPWGLAAAEAPSAISSGTNSAALGGHGTLATERSLPIGRVAWPFCTASMSSCEGY